MAYLVEFGACVTICIFVHFGPNGDRGPERVTVIDLRACITTNGAESRGASLGTIPDPTTQIGPYAEWKLSSPLGPGGPSRPKGLKGPKGPRALSGPTGPYSLWGPALAQDRDRDLAGPRPEPGSGQGPRPGQGQRHGPGPGQGPGSGLR